MVGELTAQNALPKEVVDGVAQRTGGGRCSSRKLPTCSWSVASGSGVNHQFAVMPPSITSSLPVTHEASSEAR